MEPLIGQAFYFHHGYNLSHPQITAPLTTDDGGTVTSVHESILDNVQLRQSTAPRKKFLYNKIDSTNRIQSMMYAPKPGTNKHIRHLSSHKRTGGVRAGASVSSIKYSCTDNWRNTSLSPNFLYGMASCSGSSSEAIPVLQLHKEPVAPAFPDRLICVISPRTTSS